LFDPGKCSESRTAVERQVRVALMLSFLVAVVCTAEDFSIQTTEHYLRCKQKLRYAVDDKRGIEP
jgi:hypothetical protein